MDVLTFLRQHQEYVPVIRKAIEHEEANVKNPHYLGWEWYDVQTYGSKLPRLVVEGIAKVNFKSRSTTGYLLVDREACKVALKKL